MFGGGGGGGGELNRKFYGNVITPPPLIYILVYIHTYIHTITCIVEPQNNRHLGSVIIETPPILNTVLALWGSRLQNLSIINLEVMSFIRGSTVVRTYIILCAYIPTHGHNYAHTIILGPAILQQACDRTEFRGGARGGPWVSPPISSTPPIPACYYYLFFLYIPFPFGSGMWLV